MQSSKSILIVALVAFLIWIGVLYMFLDMSKSKSWFLRYPRLVRVWGTLIGEKYYCHTGGFIGDRGHCHWGSTVDHIH